MVSGGWIYSTGLNSLGCTRGRWLPLLPRTSNRRGKNMTMGRHPVPRAALQNYASQASATLGPNFLHQRSRRVPRHKRQRQGLAAPGMHERRLGQHRHVVVATFDQNIRADFGDQGLRVVLGKPGDQADCFLAGHDDGAVHFVVEWAVVAFAQAACLGVGVERHDQAAAQFDAGAVAAVQWLLMVVFVCQPYFLW